MTREVVAPLFDWLGHTPVGVTIRSSATLIALTEIIHLLGLTMLAGTILMIDLTLLRLGIRRYPVARIAAELAPWTTGGLVVMLISGPLILSSETLKCYDSSFFWLKMATLFAAILFHFTAHRSVVRSEPPAGRFRAGLVACISLALWIGVALAGKMIGIYGDDLRQEHEPFQVHLGLLRCSVIPQPLRVAGLVDHVLGEGKHGGDDLGLLRLGGRQIKQIGISVSEHVPRPVQRGFDGPPVADSLRSTEFGDGFTMELKDGGKLNPDRLRQRANSRRAGAYRCTTSRPSA